MSTTEFTGITAGQLQRGRAITAIKGLSALQTANKSMVQRADVMRAQFGTAIGVEHFTTKDAIGVGTTATTPPVLASAFFAESEPFSILGRLTSPRVPPFVPTSVSDGPAEFAWTPEGLPAPSVALSFNGESGMEPLKLAGIVVISKELLKLSSPAAAQYLLDVLGAKYRAWLDRQMLDLTLAASPGENPASLTNAATPVASSGTSTADMVEDARRLLARFTGNGGKLERATVILSTANAIALRLSGHRAFADLTLSGGTYAGIPAICSDAAGTVIALVDQQGIHIADPGTGDLSLASHADVEMRDDPTQDGTAGTGAALVSLWQAGLVGVKVTRYINWRLAYADAVQCIAGAAYGPAGSPA